MEPLQIDRAVKELAGKMLLGNASEQDVTDLHRLQEKRKRDFVLERNEVLKALRQSL